MRPFYIATSRVLLALQNSSLNYAAGFLASLASPVSRRICVDSYICDWVWWCGSECCRRRQVSTVTWRLNGHVDTLKCAFNRSRAIETVLWHRTNDKNTFAQLPSPYIAHTTAICAQIRVSLFPSLSPSHTLTSRPHCIVCSHRSLAPPWYRWINFL